MKGIISLNRRNSGLFFAILLVVFTTFAADTSLSAGGYPDDAGFKRGVVLVRVTTVNVSYSMPWIRRPGRSFYVVGLVVPGGGILVSGNDVKDAGLIELRSHLSYRPVLARVERLDMEANLAILRPADPDFSRGLTALPPGKDPLPGQTVRAIRVDDTFNIYREDVSINEVKATPDYGYTYLPSVIFRTSEQFNSGGILLDNTGIAAFIEYSDKDKKSEATPISVIQSFIRNAAKEPYPGFVSHGFFLHDLVDPVQRQFYGLPDNDRGSLVSRVLPGTSAWGVLREKDILLSIDDVSLDNRGFYEDPELGRQEAAMLLARKNGKIRLPGESVRLRFIREGETVEKVMKLRSYQGMAERIPWIVKGQPDYYIESGFVFLELSVPYLREIFGPSWNMRSGEYAYLFSTKRYYGIPGDDRIVVIAKVLPDSVNRGMEEWSPVTVVSVGRDGKEVRNLETMAHAFETGEGLVPVVLSDNRKIFIDLSDRDKVNSRILHRYGIPSQASPSLSGHISTDD